MPSLNVASGGALVSGPLYFCKIEEPVYRWLIQQQPIAPLVGPCLYGGSQHSAEALLESCGCCNVIGMWGGPRPVGRRAARDLCFELANGPSAVGGAVRELASAVVVRFGEERLAVALRESPVVDQLDCLVGQFEESDGVGEVAAAPAEPACEVGAGDVEVVEERGDRAGLLDDSEVGAGDILDQCEL
jgi:hypothetical protein